VARVRVGVRFDPAGGGEGPERDALRLRALVEAGVRAEEAGLDVAWVGERPLGPTALVAAALPLLAALAARTRRIRLATAVLPVPAHHPLRLAEDAATVDGLSGGRLELGLGLGGDPEAVAGLGPEGVARAGALDGLVAGLREAFGAPGGAPRVAPRPLQRGGPPLWLGVRSEAGARRAALLGVGVLLEGTAVRGETYLAAWRARGEPLAEARVGLLLPPDADATRLAAALRAAGAGGVDLIACAGADDADEALAAAAAWRRDLVGRSAATRR
jgi:alkanesulfonate monooxygenase SsuD/methylene tetrahydromethanopterin reductase-like flavin-dependent oxidoreductase (luciferase family)